MLFAFLHATNARREHMDYLASKLFSEAQAQQYIEDTDFVTTFSGLLLYIDHLLLEVLYYSFDEWMAEDDDGLGLEGGGR